MGYELSKIRRYGAGDEHLAHFGILGQKWGVRRFQNEDGTLTEEGKKRYYNSDNDGLSEEGRKQFFESNSSRLTAAGRKALETDDEDLKGIIKSEKFGRDYNERWLNSYNRAADTFNRRIEELNNKYMHPAKDEKTYRKYIKEVNDLWQGIYGNVLLNDFGEHPAHGKKWLSAAFGYDMYTNADDLIDDDMRKKWAVHSIPEFDSTSLVHFGIPGQKWGIRRYQNEDGTLTEEGMRRYGITDAKGHVSLYKAKNAYRYQNNANSDLKNDLKAEKEKNKPISKRRQQLIDRYQQKGLTKEQSELAALRREKIEKTIKIAGAVALTAALAYGAYKGRQWLMKNGDARIRAGKTIFRTTRYANEELNRPGFVADNAKDAGKYVGAYGKQIQGQRGQQRFLSWIQGKPMKPDVADDNVYQITGKATKNIKVAGDRKANKVYQQLLKNDRQFAADNEVVKARWNDTENDYANFNKRLVDHEDDAAARIQKKFYDALKAKGYGGVIDANDRDRSGYHVRKPVILFNMKDNIKDVSVRTISSGEVDKKYPEAVALMRKQAVNDVLLNEAMKGTRNAAGLGAFISALGLVSAKRSERSTTVNGAYQKSVIKQYKKEHPATKLSDAEILENELGYKKKGRS